MLVWKHKHPLGIGKMKFVKQGEEVPEGILTHEAIESLKAKGKLEETKAEPVKVVEPEKAEEPKAEPEKTKAPKVESEKKKLSIKSLKKAEK